MNKFLEYATVGLTIAGSALCASGCSTVPGNAGRTIGNAIIAPAKIIRATGENLDPVRGLREGIVDTLEAGYHTATFNENNRQPHELGEANKYINQRPALKMIVDTAVAGGTAAGIAELSGANPVHVNQAAGYAAGGQLVRDSVDYATRD
jgi:hypothetical protein